MSAAHTPKGEGFVGQRIVVVPRSVVARALQDPLTRNLLPTDAGHFPTAAHHGVARPSGAPELVAIYCARGRGWVELRGVRHSVGAGDLALLPPRAPHAYGAEASDPWTIYWAHLAGVGVAALAGGIGRTVARVGMDPRIGGAFEEVLGALRSGYGPDELILAAAAAQALAARVVVEARRAGSGSPTAADRVGVAIRHLERNLAAAIRVADLAAMTHLSPQHFTEVFKQRTGYPPIDYLLRLRLARAMELVVTTDWPMKRISAEVGFASQLYFSRQFRRIYAAPPSTFRSRGED